MYCNKCGEPLKNNTQVCPYCGATQPKQENKAVEVDFSQFKPDSRPITSSSESKDDDSNYVRDSILLLVVCLIYGIIRTMAGFSSGEPHNAYKGLIACAAALVFIPSIKVGIKNEVAALLVKIIIAVAIIIFI